MFRVAGTYALVAWVVTQVANVAFPALHLPGWTVTFVVVVALLGFPIAVVLAWAFEITPQGVRRTPPLSSERRARRRLARGIQLVPRPVWVVLVVVAAAWATWNARPRRAPPQQVADSADPAVIAVLPFSVHGTERWAYLGEGIVNLLSAKLDGAGDLRSVDPHALLSAVGRGDSALDPARASEIARRFDAGLYVLGDILEASERLRISASLYAVGEAGDAVTRVTVEGGEGEIFGLVDELVRQLLAGRSAGPGDRLLRLAAVTTDSLRALKAYLEGEAEFRAGRFDSAAAPFQHAVEIDRSFALAWYRLSLAAEWSGQRERARAAARQAAGHAERLSERDRLLIRALQAYLDGAAEDAERLYRTLLGAYPDDVEAWYQLGEVLFHSNPLRGRPVAEAAEPFRRVLEFEPAHLRALLHLTQIAAAERRSADLDSLTVRVLRASSGSNWEWPMRAFRAFVLSEGDAGAILDQVAETDASTVTAAIWLISCAGELQDALALADRLARDRRSVAVQVVGHVAGAYLEVARGRWRRAEAKLAAAEALDPEAALQHRALLATAPLAPATPDDLRALLRALTRWQPTADAPAIANPATSFNGHARMRSQVRLYLVGRVRARLGDHAGALRAARELEGNGDGSGERGHTRDLAWALRAEVARADGHPADALAALDHLRAETYHEVTFLSPFPSQAFTRYVRAEAHAQRDDIPEALRWFHTFAGLSLSEWVYVAPSHLRRAQLFERVYRPAETADHYARFVQLWKDADPPVRPLVDAARVRLSRVADGTLRGGGPASSVSGAGASPPR